MSDQRRRTVCASGNAPAGGMAAARRESAARTVPSRRRTLRARPQSAHQGRSERSVLGHDSSHRTRARTDVMPSVRAVFVAMPATVQSASTVPHISAREAAPPAAREKEQGKGTAARSAVHARVKSGSSFRRSWPSCSTASVLAGSARCGGSGEALPSISFTAPFMSNSDTPSTVAVEALHL